MKNLFEVETRFLSDSAVIYGVTNKKDVAERVELLFNSDDCISIDDICDELTPARRKMVYAAIELYKRIEERKKNVTKVKNSADIFNAMARHIADLPVEEAWVVLLNQGARIIKKVRISRGGLACTQVDVRVVLREALKARATAIILCHNHPSGNVRPSGDDDRLTTALFNAAKTLNIRMLDHVVISSEAFYSYADEGRL